MAQHEQLGVLGQIRPDQYRQQAQQASQQPVDKRQRHPAMVPSRAPDPAAETQLTLRNRVSERDTMEAHRLCDRRKYTVRLLTHWAVTGAANYAKRG
jgi:hypothetical protein